MKELFANLTVLLAFSLSAMSCSDRGVEVYVPVDNGGKPAGGTEVPTKSKGWSALADSCETVLIENFMNLKEGTFW